MSIILTIIQCVRQLRWTLPWQCVLCHGKASSQYSLCSACEKDLPILSRSCHRCARILIIPTISESDLLMCGQCTVSPPPVERTYALFHYETPITEFIIRLKFHQKLIYANLLGHLLIKKIEESWYDDQKTLPDLLLPVPLHQKRLQHRGFNQALEITRPIAKKYNIPTDTTGVQRTRATEAQSLLSAEERKKNLAGAFLSCKRYDGMSIAIIDDVMTTTHTVFELANLLKQKGAVHVVAWIAARADYR
jgi:ComF family protein